MHKGIITVAGGKGGTGKTFVTANLGTALAQIGHKVIIVDADFGGSDLNQFMSIKRPKHSLSNILLNENKELRGNSDRHRDRQPEDDRMRSSRLRNG